MSESTNEEAPAPPQSVKVQIGSMEEIIEAANTICEDSSRECWEEVDIEKKIEAFHGKYPDFARTFPMALRHITQTNKVYTKALTNFVELCSSNPTHSMEEFQKRQAEYLIFVYKEDNPRAGKREIAKLRKKYVDGVEEEKEHMKRVMDEVKDEKEKQKAKHNEEKRREILDMIKGNMHRITKEQTVNMTVKNKYENESESDSEDESRLVVVPQEKSNKTYDRKYDDMAGVPENLKQEYYAKTQPQFEDDDDDDDKIQDYVDSDEDVDDK